MDKFWERYIQSRPAPGESKGAFDAFAAAHKEPRITAQEPRTLMAKADIPDAFNPDLEQTEVLRPGETLETWKPNPFLKPHAEGGRIGLQGGQLVRNTADGSRPGYGGYPPSQFADYGSRHKGFNQWIKDNKIDFKNATNKRDIILKFERSQIAKNYITPNELARVLAENGSPYGDAKNFADQFRLASLKEGKDKVLNAKIRKAKKLVKIVNDEFGIERFSLKDINKEFEALSHRPTDVSLGTGKFPERYIKIDKTFNKKMNKVIKGLDQEFGKVGFKANTIDNIFSLYDDKKFMKELKNYTGGKVNPKSYLFKTAFQSGDKAYAFMQLGRILKGEIDLEGISPNKNTGNKIIKSMAFDSVGKKYGHMWNASYEYAKFKLNPYLGKDVNYQTLSRSISQAFKEAGVTGQNIDEIFPLRTGRWGVGKGSDAYSNFVQFIDKEINQGKKVAFDRTATTRYNEIMKLWDSKTNKFLNPEKVTNLVKKHDAAIEKFYKENPKAKGKVNLTQLRWDSKTNKFLSPKQVFESQYKGSYKTIPEKIRKGMEKFHEKTGLSFDPGTTRTLEKSAADVKALKQGKAWNKAINSSKAKMLAKTLELAGIDICSGQLVKKSSGGRIGFASKKCGVAFAAENPDGFMKKAAQSEDAADLFRSGNIAKHLMKAKNWAKSNMGPAGWIGGELLIVGLGSVWDMSQGKGWKEALDNWTGLGGHFGQAEKRLKEIGIEQGYSEQEINDAMKIGQLMDLSTEAEGKQWELDQLLEAQDIGGTARVKYDPKLPGAYKPIQGRYQDPKKLRELKAEVPKIWEKGDEIYESLKDYDFSVDRYYEMNERKKREEYDRMIGLRNMPRNIAAGQQFDFSPPPEYKPWVPYAGGGMVGIRKPNAIAPTGGPMSQGLRSLYINDKDY